MIAKGRVSARPIIEHLDIFEDVLRRGFTGRVVPMVYEFTLECPEETLDTGIVPAVACAAHAGGEGALVEQTLVARGRILTAAI